MWIAIAPLPWRLEWQAPLVAAAATVTPGMVWRDQVLLLDTHASLQWLGGARGLKRHLKRELMSLEIAGRIAMAHTALGAWLLVAQAKQAGIPTDWVWHYALSQRRLAQRLDQVAITAMPQARSYLDWFTQLGCHVLGQLRTLDRSELLARTDRVLLQTLDQAYGQTVFAYQPLKLPVQFREHLELPRLIQDTDALQPYTKRLLYALCAWLKANHLTVSHLECRLHHRDRRRARQPTVIMIAIAKSTDEQSVLWRWLSVRLERMTLPAPVSDIALLTRTLANRQERNLLLFEDDVSSSRSVSDTLDLLRARLGQSGVKQAQPTADHRPEVANRWQAWSNDKDISLSTQAKPSVDMDWGAHCPSWLLPEPKTLVTRQDQPQLNGPLRLLHGPWRVETGWWDAHLIARDYFVATDHSARRYWIYRERAQTSARWFLHGLFG